MNASELAYWYRHGRGPLFGEDPSSDPAPGRRKKPWLSDEERAAGRSTMRTIGAPFRAAGRGLEEVFRMPRRGPQPQHPDLTDEDIAAGLMFADPSLVPPLTDEDLEGASPPSGDVYGVIDAALDRMDREIFGLESGAERFGGKEKRLERLEDRLLALEEQAEAGVDGRRKKKLDRKISRTKKKIARLQGKLGVEPDEDDDEDDEEESFGLDGELDRLSFQVDDLSSEVDDLHEEAYGIIGIDDALIIGLSAAGPAIALALKSKAKRLESLQKKLGKLEAKSAGATGKKADRIGRKIARVSRRIEKLEAKIREKESMGLYSRHTFVPAELDHHDPDTFVPGVRRAGAFGFDDRTSSAVRTLSSRWLGRAGVVGVWDDMWREGPVIVVSTVDGLRPSGMPKRFEGHRIVVVRGRPTYGGFFQDVGKGLASAGKGIGKAAKTVGGGMVSAAKTVGHGVFSAGQWAGGQVKKADRAMDQRRENRQDRRNDKIASSFTFAPPSSVQPFQQAQAQPSLLSTFSTGLQSFPGGPQPRKIVVKYGALADAVVDEMFGSMPFGPDEGPWQLQSADAATADGGTIVQAPAVPDARLDPAADRGVAEGVEEFLRQRRRLSFPR